MPRQIREILDRVKSETGSTLDADRWFRSEQLPGFDGATADRLVRDGRAGDVHAYLDRVLTGGYA